jgi:hypothetical protein
VGPLALDDRRLVRAFGGHGTFYLSGDAAARATGPRGSRRTRAKKPAIRRDLTACRQTAAVRSARPPRRRQPVPAAFRGLHRLSTDHPHVHSSYPELVHRLVPVGINLRSTFLGDSSICEQSLSQSDNKNNVFAIAQGLRRPESACG